jgi:uncharacterized protein (TIGR04255 family)
MSDKRSWKNAPLILVIAEVQFDDNNAIEDSSTAIQKALAQHGFVGTQTHKINQANIVLNESGLTPTVETVELQQVFNAQATQVFTIGRHQLSFTQSDYTDFETFRDTFQRGIKIISEQTQLTKPIRRLGLRYLDLMQNSENLPLEKQVQSALMGFSISEQDGNEIFSTSSDGKSRLVFKAITGVTLIPHLQQNIGQIPTIPRLSIPIQVKDTLVIDIDVIQEWNLNTPNRPLITEISEILKSFHEKASQVFTSSLTSNAFLYYRGW